jgi:hypothetical protein
MHEMDNGGQVCETENQSKKFTCDVINKRSIGRIILKMCGNEGTEDDANQATIRRLLQEIINYTDEESESVWRNASLTLFDKNFAYYTITSGRGQNKFVVSYDGFGNPKVVKAAKNYCCIA